MAAGVLNSALSMSPPDTVTEEDKFNERKRDILVLVMRFLADYGFLVTYQSLCAEASMTLDQVDAADNIDLMTIVQEFVDYYHSKFGRYPKLIRRNFQPPLAYQGSGMPI
ncbi:hypothetical protein OEZ85_002499 [Tetradesmus obliquus]|uniref:LisH domain-containing protein n=1 Tax=Tetradesmus obliquus TaxID=3088 RepID=A0ABY8TXP6_TETOB|nr:hypothetical protein OEZ85_002499 [Tetradesmus obliquus]